MSKKESFFSVSKGLRLGLDHDGNLYASISPSSGNFFLSIDALIFLSQLIKKNGKIHPQKMPLLLQKELNSVQQNIPSAKECQNLLEDFIAAGVVFDEKEAANLHLQNDGFGDPWIQWAMLADSVRCNAYYNALKALVNKDSIVLDLGAGTGLLSAIALKLGAQKVYAIEETNSGHAIKPIIQKLGLPLKKLHVYNKNSMDVKFSDEISLVVSELFGNDPFQEGLIPTLRELSKKTNSQQTIYIPNKLSVYCEIIEIKDHPISHRINKLQEIKSSHFIDEFLRSAKDILNLNTLSFPIALKNENIIPLSSEYKLQEIQLNTPESLSKINSAKGKIFCKLNTCSNHPVLLLWFRAHLYQDISISSRPGLIDSSEHWSPIVIPLQCSVLKGEEISILYNIDEYTESSLHIDIFKAGKCIGKR